MTRAASPCPAPEALARLAEGSASAAERPGLEVHVGGCPLCRGIVGGLARAQGRSAPGSAPAPRREPTELKGAPAAPRSLWWVPWLTHAVLALGVGLAAWWFFGRTGT